MTSTELIMVAGLVLNFVGTLIAIFRAQLKTENRLTHVETMVSVMIRKTMPQNYQARVGDNTSGM